MTPTSFTHHNAHSHNPYTTLHTPHPLHTTLTTPITHTPHYTHYITHTPYFAPPQPIHPIIHTPYFAHHITHSHNPYTLLYTLHYTHFSLYLYILTPAKHPQTAYKEPDNHPSTSHWQPKEMYQRPPQVCTLRVQHMYRIYTCL